MLKGIAFGFVCLMMTGCAFHAQKATLSPTLSVTSSAIGAGRDISLKVDDERPSTSLGHRGTAYGAAAEITTDQDLAALIRNKVAEGLTNEGYHVVNVGEGHGMQLGLQLRELKYTTSTGFWTGGIQVDGALKARVSDGNGIYEKLYRSDKKKRVIVVPTAGKNQEWLNSALSDLLRQVFDDPAMSSFLARSAPSHSGTPNPQVAAQMPGSTPDAAQASVSTSTTAAPESDIRMREAIRAQQVSSHLGCGEVSPANNDEFTASCGNYSIAIDCSGGSCHPTHTIRTN